MSPMRSGWYWLWISVFAAAATPAASIEMCSGGDRAARRLYCVVDGDTIWQDGVKMRLQDIDAPETHGAACPAEKAIGDRATRRLQQLMSGGYKIVDSGQKDRTSDRRALVRVILPEGRDAGKILLLEGLAQPWPNRGNRWCDR